MSEIPGYNPPAETEEDDPRGREALLPADFESSYENDVTFGVTVPTGLDPRFGPGGHLMTPGNVQTYENQAPRYFENDQSLIWVGDSTTGRSPSTLSQETVAAYQRNMVAAGLLSEGGYSPGVWDSSTVAANRELLRTSNVTGRNASTTLSMMAQHGAALRSSSGRGGGGGGRVAPTIRLTNADDLKATFRQVARQTTGGVFVDDNQISSMVETYHQKERDYQLALARGGGSVESAPSAGTFAEGALEGADEGGAMANRFAQMTAALGSLMG